MMNIYTSGLFQNDGNSYPNKFVYAGINNFTAPIDRKQATVAYNIDSSMNWLTSWPRTAPNTFLNPTSFDLSVALAVARLIKLMQAMIKIKMAIDIKTYTIFLFPCFTLRSKASLAK